MKRLLKSKLSLGSNWDITLESYNASNAKNSGEFEAPISLLSKPKYNDLELYESTVDIFDNWVANLIIRADKNILGGKVRKIGWVFLDAEVKEDLTNAIISEIEALQNNGYARLANATDISIAGSHSISTGNARIDKALDTWISEDAKRYLIRTAMRNAIQTFPETEQEEEPTFVGNAASTFREGLDVDGNIIDGSYSTPNLFWDSKQDVVILVGATETTVSDSINFLFNNYTDLSEFRVLEEEVEIISDFLTDNFEVTNDSKLKALNPLTAPTTFANKKPEEYSQQSDVNLVDDNSVIRDNVLNLKIFDLEEKTDLINATPIDKFNGDIEGTRTQETFYDTLVFDISGITIQSFNALGEYVIDINLGITEVPEDPKTLLKNLIVRSGFWTNNTRNNINYEVQIELDVTGQKPSNILFRTYNIATELNNSLIRVAGYDKQRFLGKDEVLGIKNSTALNEIWHSLNTRDISGNYLIEDSGYDDGTTIYDAGTKLASQGWANVKFVGLEEDITEINQKIDKANGVLFEGITSSLTGVNIGSIMELGKQYTIQIVNSGTSDNALFVVNFDNGRAIHRDGESQNIESQASDARFIHRDVSNTVFNAVIFAAKSNKTYGLALGIDALSNNASDVTRYEYEFNAGTTFYVRTSSSTMDILVREL